MEAEMESRNCGSFFQPLLPDFLHSFSIPAEFVEKELKVELDSVVLMRQKKGKEKVKHWVVKIKGGRHFSSDGWNRFALHHHLKVGDFLVFTHLGNFIFNVCVYDSLTACDTSDSIHQNQKQQLQLQLPTCNFTLTTYSAQKHVIYLPKRFTKGTGLAQRRCMVTLIDPQKRWWEVKLSYKKGSGQSYICRGWKAFQDANGLKGKDVICFQPLSAGKSPVINCYIHPH